MQRRTQIAWTHWLCVMTVGSFAGCGQDLSARAQLATPASELSQNQALTAEPIVDLDGLFHHPATRHYMHLASTPSSPCNSLLKDVTSLAAQLAPAIAAKNYGAIAADLPQILSTLQELFACVKAKHGQSGDPNATPSDPNAGGGIPNIPGIPGNPNGGGLPSDPNDLIPGGIPNDPNGIGIPGNPNGVDFPTTMPLPEAPEVPAFDAHATPCVTVLWNGSAARTCP